MREPIVESEHLYESLWWTRLAAFSEKRESPVPVRLGHPEKKRSSFSKKLASVFRRLHFSQERGHNHFFPLGGIKF
jgi:hypothetical protein